MPARLYVRETTRRGPPTGAGIVSSAPGAERVTLDDVHESEDGTDEIGPRNRSQGPGRRYREYSHNNSEHGCLILMDEIT